MNHFQNKTIWITGASSGIGEALAYKFSEAGARLILSARRGSELERVKKNCKNAENNIYILPLDLEKTETMNEAVKEALSFSERIDYLINNGGISQRSLVYETSLEVDRKIMEINYFGTIALTKAILPVMMQQKSGHIAVTSSIVGKFGFPLRSAYSASKHALHGFFETLRAELVDYNIHVSMIIPGRILTNISVNAITKNGEKYGLLDDGQANGMTAEEAAQKILNAMKKKRKEILVGKKEVLMVHIRRFLPRLYYKLASKVSAV